MTSTSPLLQNDLLVDELLPPERAVEAEIEVQEPSVLKTSSDVKATKSYAMIYAVKALKTMMQIFFASALLTLGNKAAGCDTTDDDSDDECDKTIYGIRPSSLTAALSITSSIIAILFLPIIGSMIDFTPHKRSVGIWSAYTLVIGSFILIGTTEDTWLIMSVIIIVLTFSKESHDVVIFSYLANIGDKVDDDTMANFSSQCSIRQYATVIFYLLLVTGIGLVFGLGDVDLSRVASGTAGGIMGIFFLYWFSMPNVPALHTIPSGQNLLTAGFYQNCRTFKGISKYYGDGLKLFLIGNCFICSGAKATVSTTIIIMKDVLGMEGAEIGIFFIITLVFSIPGAKIASIVSKKLSPVASMKIVSVIWPCIVMTAVLVIDRPEIKGLVYVEAMAIGMCVGWLYPTANLLFSLTIPRGQETELSAFYIYSTHILDWLPQLVFTLINQSGASKKIGMLGVVLFFLPGFISFQCMAPWEDVRLSAKERSKMILDE